MRKLWIAIASTVGLCPSFAAETGPLVHEAVIDAPLADVWAAFTTKEGMESWMVAHADIELKVGGKMRTHYSPAGVLGDPGTIENTILSFEPQRMLSIRATRPPENFPFKDVIANTWSVIHFEPLGANRTLVRTVGMGYADDEQSQKMRLFFQKGNALTLEKLRGKFATAARPGASQGGGTDEPPNAVITAERSAQALARLRGMIGGEWVHESRNEKGAAFRSRSVVEGGPDGKSLTARGWLGGDDGMFAHSATQAWIEPASGVAQFQNIDEGGNVARGVLALADDSTVVWDWNAVAPGGRVTHFKVEQAFETDDSYRMRLHRQMPDGAYKQMFDLEFRRVEKSPAEFLKMRPPATPG